MAFKIENGVLKKYREKDGVTEVIIPDSVTEIGRDAFRDCTSLESITIPNSVTKIGWDAFRDCTSLKSIIIPDSVTEIGWDAFNGCTRLKSITIPDSVTKIGRDAFYRCSSLKSITIPDSITEIGYAAFNGCTSLESIEVDENNKVYYSENNAIITITDKKLVVGCKNTVIPDSVTSIDSSAFNGCTSLESITIPDSVIEIGGWAFSNCTSLKSITISDSVTKIGDGAFCACTSLESITIPDSVTEIGRDAFSRCSSLKNITIPNSVTKIGRFAFESCTSLESITIPDSVKSIGEWAFSRCSSLESITIPDSVTKIGSCAFGGCTSLESITIPDSVIEIGTSVFGGCTSLKSIIIPDSVTEIGEYAFSDCTNLKNITIADSVNSIEKNAFKGCKKLKTLDISPVTLKHCKDETIIKYVIKHSALDDLIKNIKNLPKKYKANAEDKIKASDDVEAAKYFEKLNRLDEYARAHSTDADTLRDSFLYDFGLDENGTKTWSLGDFSVIAKLGKDLSVVLYDENGKELKSVPKKGADADKYDIAKKEFASLKKEIPAAAKLRNKTLITDWLEKHSRTAQAWKDTYLKNPFLTALAKLVVWQQGDTRFILNSEGVPVDVQGNTVELSDKDIILAHPMEMSSEDVESWQAYLTDNKISQPFAQMWEPVTDSSIIKPDRYTGATIQLHYLMNKEFHGITMRGQSKLELKDCTADLKLVEGHSDWYNNEFEISNFRFNEYTRYVNHIVTHFDKDTTLGRLLKDDVSAVQYLDRFNLEQINDFIRKVTEKETCPNATAALLAYKNEHYPDSYADPFADFVLDW